MGDIVEFGRKPQKPRKTDSINPLRVIWACVMLGAISISLVPFGFVYALLYWTMPKAAREDSKVLIMVVHNYLMDFLRSIESGRRVVTNVDTPDDSEG